MQKLDLIATTTFGLEATVKRELERMGYAETRVSDGRVDFCGDISAIARANLWLRSSDRVLLRLGEFSATTFDELFEGTKALPWGDWITKDGKFTVTGKSVKSGLFSVPDCQAIVKKAVVEKLRQRHNVDWFDETGPEYKIQVALLKDVATLTIDTTGPGLHKRGYREHAGAAPLKETLAAALIELSFWKNSRILLDGVCGSGTIPIEAAMMARGIAPGLNRGFVSQDWPQIPEDVWKEERRRAYAAISYDTEPQIYGSDIDPAVIELAKANAAKAGVDDCITFEATPLAKLRLPGESGVAIFNPPYGDRMASAKEAAALYREMGALFGGNGAWSVYVITSDEDFERHYGARADKKRKLFNGMIKTDYYQFHGKKPHSGKKPIV
ncbi:MAG: class I SAM-dependent RNA methyltransferase [Defluviitaleaceae bacterium]|nr:class I SAM-dependent RNA methyltransferase [Defluviitaleaceae bacterium]